MIVPAAMGGFWNWFDSITGLSINDGANLTISVGNTEPTIISVVLPNSSIAIPEANSVVYTWYVYVNDSDGEANLDGSATVTLNLSIPYNAIYNIANTPRVNNSCVNTGQTFGGFERNFTCSIEFHYFDTTGDWNATVQATDINNAANQSTTTGFTVDAVQGILISPINITWPQLGANTYNQTPLQNITVNNTGNWNVSVFNVTAYDLVGASEHIPGDNFTVGRNFTNSCDIAHGKVNRTINGSAVSLTNDTYLASGNYSIGDGSGQMDFYLCLREVPALSAGTYATLTQWDIKAIE